MSISEATVRRRRSEAELGSYIADFADEHTLLFMQDNAPCHKALPVVEFLEENYVPLMQWPQSQPDREFVGRPQRALSPAVRGVVQSSIEELKRVIDMGKFCKTYGIHKEWN